MRFLAALAAALLVVSTAAAQPMFPMPETVQYDEDLPREQQLNVYLPDGEPPYPTVITIHGGGFLSGSLSTLIPLARALQREGFAVVNITYRLVPGSLYPAPVNDAFCALAWVAATADDYGFDLAHTAVLGESAGGYLATLLASVADPAPYLDGCPHADAPLLRPNAAVIYFPLIDYAADDFQPIGAALGIGLLDGERIGVPSREQLARVERLNALQAIDGDEPPFLILHGTRDRLVPFTQSLMLADALARADVASELHLLAGADHGFAAALERPTGAEAAALAVRFLREQAGG